MTFKPLLASPVDFTKLDYADGVLVSAKLDGIRCLIRNGQAVSRSLKPIKNEFIQGILADARLDFLDGELIVGKANDPNVYQITNSGVMRVDGVPDFKFYVFDSFYSPEAGYMQRVDEMMEAVQALPPELRRYIEVLVQHQCFNEKEVLEIEQQYLDDGYEGVMIRRPNAPYKFGRASAGKREQHLLKLKRFVDDEAEIIGFQELMSNQNVATRDKLGHTERSTAREGLVPMGTLGALLARDQATGVEFAIGTGFTAAQRQSIWDSRHKLLGGLAKYKSFKIGVKDAPRFPVFLGFRDRDDASNG